MKANIVVPSEFKVGYQSRNDTFSKFLGYMIYANKSDGSYGQQKSFDQWIEKKYTPKIINNHPRLGFVINKGLLNKYHFGASAKFRVYHPEGYEFEISLENLSMLLAYTDTSCGEIKSPCTIGWQGTNVFLIPEVQNINTIVNIKYYDVTQVQQKAKNKLDKINNNGKALSKRVLTTGKIVENKSGQRFVICAPTSTQKEEDFPTIPLITTEILKDEKIFSIINPFYQNDGYNKIFKSYDEISKFFYPLNKIDNKLNADMMDDFVKILTKDDLTPSELNALKQLKETTVPFYSPNIKFESLNEELKEPEVFLSSIVKKYYQLMQKLDGNKEKIFFTNKVVEKNGVPYIIGFNFDYKLFKKHQYFDTTNVYRKASYVLNASKYCDSLSLFFMPLNKTMDNPYKEDDVTEQFSIYFDKETLKVIDDNFMNKEKIANLLKSKYYCFQSEKEKEEAEKDQMERVNEVNNAFGIYKKSLLENIEDFLNPVSEAQINQIHKFVWHKES